MDDRIGVSEQSLLGLREGHFPGRSAATSILTCIALYLILSLICAATAAAAAAGPG